jgi:transcriptional regulator GlxA family with amidase domain
LVVPALGVFDAADIERVLARPAARKVREFLCEMGPKERPRLAGATGTFLLAVAGCLDDHRATTSWWLSAFFARRYPAVTLDMTRMVLDSGTIVTAGVAFAHMAWRSASSRGSVRGWRSWSRHPYSSTSAPRAASRPRSGI